MKAQIIIKARDLGFDACRVGRAERPASGPRFEAWLAAGFDGEMHYLKRTAARRLDPQRVLPGARSAIALAISYHANPGLPPSAFIDLATRGVIARYARHDDYHDVLAPRLRELSEFVTRLGPPGTRSLWYVDTGPILERDLAERTGLGFIGKHTNLISRQLGNWFFIAEILTTLELDTDPSEKNRCGTCTRCISACPTGAIVGPFQLDARRCISYLTIELRGDIPLALRPAVGARIFGCDDCLEVCPWNRFAREGRLLREHRRAELSQPDLIPLLDLDEAGFRARFAGTPVLRTRRRGLRRNVCVALGNVGDRRALPALERAACESDPLVAEHAGWAIDQIQKRTQSPRSPHTEHG